MTHGILTIPDLNLTQINDALKRIQDALDTIEGVRGTWTRGRWTFESNRIKYTDTNGTVLHGFGSL